MFTLIKINRSHEGILRAERTGNFGTQFFCMPLILTCEQHSEETYSS